MHFFDSLQMDILVVFVVLTQQVVVWTRMQSAEIPSASVSIVLRISMAHAKRVSLDAYSANPKMFIKCIDFFWIVLRHIVPECIVKLAEHVHM